MKYKVNGTTKVYIEYIVEADSEEETIDMATQELGGLASFCGNGGIDKLVGVYDSNASIYPDEETEWENAEIIK